MAETVRTGVITKPRGTPEASFIVTWTGLDADDSGSPVELVAFSDRSVQMTGTWGAGGTVVLQGSNDGTTYFTLDDPQGTGISYTADGFSGVGPVARYMRPLATGGDGTTDIKVVLLCVGPKKG